MADLAIPPTTAPPSPAPHVLASLRTAHRRFVWPVTMTFLVVFLLTVWLAAYRPAWMATPAVGSLSVGVLVVLANFVLTFAITVGYRSYANRILDPLAARVNADLDAAHSETEPR